MSRNETRQERIGTTTKKEKLRRNEKEGDKTRKNGTKQEREGQNEKQQDKTRKSKTTQEKSGPKREAST